MENQTLIILALFVLGFGMISGWLKRSIITPPMIFVTFGFLMGPRLFGFIEFDIDNKIIHTLAEITLVLILFTDASLINLKILIKERCIPLRLLNIGMPLTIIFGTLLALIFFDYLKFWEAAVVAAILAPTDAALGQAVVTSKHVPVRIRQALNVESGLNDGLALPVVLLLSALAGATQANASVNFWFEFTAKQIILGPLVGIGIGYMGGKMMHLCLRIKCINDSFHQLSAVAMALLVFWLAESIGGNGFLASFCAGLTIGNICQDVCHRMYEFAEVEGQLLKLLTFLIFGNIMVSLNLDHINWPIVLYGILSLTVVRMIPVAISLIGTRLKWDSILFLGWFGPRGIASILFGLLILEKVNINAREEIYLIVISTVLMSIFLHGLSAGPWSKVYSTCLEKKKDKTTMVEFKDAHMG